MPSGEFALFRDWYRGRNEARKKEGKSSGRRYRRTTILNPMLFGSGRGLSWQSSIRHSICCRAKKTPRLDMSKRKKKDNSSKVVIKILFPRDSCFLERRKKSITRNNGKKNTSPFAFRELKLDLGPEERLVCHVTRRKIMPLFLAKQFPAANLFVFQ